MSRSIIIASIAAAAFFMAPAAKAQNFDLNNSQSEFGVTAGFNLTLPFGGKTSNKAENKARFGLQMGLTQNYYNRNQRVTSHRSIDFLELGVRLDGTPNILLNGQDLYTPLFAPTYHADDSDDNDDTKKSDNGKTLRTVTIVAGAVVVTGFIVTAIIADDFEDTFE